LHRWLVWGTAALMAMPLLAGHVKISKDLDKIDPTAQVDVIVQFNVTLSEKLQKKIKDKGGSFRRSLGLIRGGSFRVPAFVLPLLASDPLVRYISLDRRVRTTNTADYALEAINAVAAKQFGYTGNGIGVAIIDSGVAEHEDFKTADKTRSRVEYRESFVTGNPAVGDAWGHGTHVAGIVGGGGYKSSI
jgi:serine protease AprX